MSETPSTDQIIATSSAATAPVAGKDARSNKLGRGNPQTGQRGR